ncbi:MAG: 4-hydroxybenzoate octaprenyltransferase [Chloroflexi bacterium]|nr:4-hydroxybenzoate octaprenyltransferase [Chloroflexota bacterium]
MSYLAVLSSNFKVYSEAIKLEHSIFALPFALLTFFIVLDGTPNYSTLFWIIVSMVSMRSFGMAANRIIDREIDKKNPRTSGRALPLGLISLECMLFFTVVSLLVFIFSVLNLHTSAMKFLPIPIIIMVVYPYLKRFTWLAHYGLGVVYLIVPSAVEIAINGNISLGILFIGVAAMFWVSGFDILYAISDFDVDKKQKIYSIPSKFGINKALTISRLSHAVSVIMLFIAGMVLNSGVLFFVGVIVTKILLIYEQSLISPENLKKLNMAFFTMNGVISLIFGIFVILGEVLNL